MRFPDPLHVLGVTTLDSRILRRYLSSTTKLHALRGNVGEERQDLNDVNFCSTAFSIFEEFFYTTSYCFLKIIMLSLNIY